MAENQHENGKNRFLFTNLVLLGGLILVLATLVGVYLFFLAPRMKNKFDDFPTPNPTFTSTATATITFTPTPSQTPKPSLTPVLTHTPIHTLIPTLTFTPPGPPTLSPARPLPQAGRYHLKQWTAEDADTVFRLMNDYPNTLLQGALEEGSRAYYEAFRFANLALKEALLRFPDSLYAITWQWELAYNLARTGDPACGDQYKDLLLQSLNRGEVDLGHLYIWFKQQEPRMDLYMVELQAPEGYVGSYLVEVRGNGSAFIWLLETDQAFRGYSLICQFDFAEPHQSSWITADLDGLAENGDEIAIYFSTPKEKTVLDPPVIYNLSQIPPRQLPFVPEQAIFDLGMDYDNYWALKPGENQMMELVFRSSVFPACSVKVERRYQWDGQNFAFLGGSFAATENPLSMAYCDIASKHAAYTWGPEAAIQIMEPLVQSWPPEKTVDGKTYPAGTHDEWVYRLGIMYALAGKVEEALGAFNSIIEAPSIPRSPWIQPAKDFLKNYQDGETLYKACVLTTYCDPSTALAALINNAPKDEDLLVYLRNSGVELTASGFFDFDKDGETERWINVKYRLREKPEFWILAATVSGIEGLRVSSVESNPPKFDFLDAAYLDEQDIHLQPAIFMENKFAFHMDRMPENDAPYLVPVALRQEYPNRFLAGLQKIESALFKNEPPKQIQKDLFNLASNPGLLCVNTWSCDAYYYLLGLASELAGDPRAAIEAYHRLWSDYSKSPYTTIARLKLEGEVLLTATPTATLTPTPTISPTPTVTGTPPTATPSETITQTPAMSITPSPTTSVTPAHTPIVSPSPTAGISPYPPPYPTPTPYIYP